MTKTKELIICIISIIALVLAITTNVFATETQDITTLMGNNATNNTENNDFQEISGTTNNNTIKNISNTNNTINNKNVNNTTNTIPYTGIDYSVVVIIAICGVSAVYAYKKIRDYNV